MEERHHIKEQEFRFLADIYAQSPELFSQKTFIEDAQTLSEFGIFIPGKESCPLGLLKLWPEDFIVEEDIAGSVAEVSGTSSVAHQEGTTVYATLVKCNLSTIEVVEDLCKKLNLRTEDIAYAGIKDKDAITAQKISFRGTTLEKVSVVASPNFFLKDIHTGKGVVQKGSLSKNKFTIFIRIGNDDLNEHVITTLMKKVEAIEQFGFYNFFYLQRFGTPRLRNFATALMILKGDYKGAVKDVFTYQGERELPYFRTVRAQIEQQFGRWDEIQKLIEPLPLMFRHERKLTEYLIAHPEDYKGALQTIPEQVTIWMYALGSILFNQYISNCLMKNKEPPETLPFFLSDKRSDWELYKDMLESLDIYPPPFSNLRPFPHIFIKSRNVATKTRVDIKKAQAVEGGVVLEFELGKGQYATTFLSHLFTLTAGVVPEGFSKHRIDPKAILGEPPLTQTLEHFSQIIRPKGENVFQSFLEEKE